MTSIRRLTALALGSRPHCQEHPERSMIDFTGCAVCRSRLRSGDRTDDKRRAACGV